MSKLYVKCGKWTPRTAPQKPQYMMVAPVMDSESPELAESMSFFTSSWLLQWGHRGSTIREPNVSYAITVVETVGENRIYLPGNTAKTFKLKGHAL